MNTMLANVFDLIKSLFSPYATFRGFKRIKIDNNRVVIYNHNDIVNNLLELNTYTIPFPKRRGLTRLKSNMFFSNVAYGEAISKAWKYLEKNSSVDATIQQQEINKIFYDFFPSR
jgi:hypothetical protein